MKKKVLTLLLSLAIMVTFMPMSVFADAQGDNPKSNSETGSYCAYIFNEQNGNVLKGKSIILEADLERRFTDYSEWYSSGDILNVAFEWKADGAWVEDTNTNTSGDKCTITVKSSLAASQDNGFYVSLVVKVNSEKVAEESDWITVCEEYYTADFDKNVKNELDVGDSTTINQRLTCHYLDTNGEVADESVEYENIDFAATGELGFKLIYGGPASQSSLTVVPGVYDSTSAVIPFTVTKNDTKYAQFGIEFYRKAAQGLEDEWLCNMWYEFFYSYFDIDESTMNANDGRVYRAFTGEDIEDDVYVSLDKEKLVKAGWATKNGDNYELDDNYTIIWQSGEWNYNGFEPKAIFENSEIIGNGMDLTIESEKVANAYKDYSMVGINVLLKNKSGITEDECGFDIEILEPEIPYNYTDYMVLDGEDYIGKTEKGNFVNPDYRDGKYVEYTVDGVKLKEGCEEYIDLVKEDDGWSLKAIGEGTAIINVTMRYTADDVERTVVGRWTLNVVPDLYRAEIYDDQNCSVLRGQSITLTADLCHQFPDHSDWYGEGEIGNVKFDWDINSEWVLDKSFSSNKDTCTITIKEDVEDADWGFDVGLQAKVNGEPVGEKTWTSVYVCDEYYLATTGEYNRELIPGNSVIVAPILTYYYLDNGEMKSSTVSAKTEEDAEPGEIFYRICKDPDYENTISVEDLSNGSFKVSKKENIWADFGIEFCRKAVEEKDEVWISSCWYDFGKVYLGDSFILDKKKLNYEDENSYIVSTGTNPLTGEDVNESVNVSIDKDKLVEAGFATKEDQTYTLKEGYSIIWQAVDMSQTGTTPKNVWDGMTDGKMGEGLDLTIAAEKVKKAYEQGNPNFAVRALLKCDDENVADCTFWLSIIEPYFNFILDKGLTLVDGYNSFNIPKESQATLCDSNHFPQEKVNVTINSVGLSNEDEAKDIVTITDNGQDGWNIKAKKINPQDSTVTLIMSISIEGETYEYKEVQVNVLGTLYEQLRNSESDLSAELHPGDSIIINADLRSISTDPAINGKMYSKGEIDHVSFDWQYPTNPTCPVSCVKSGNDDETLTITVNSNWKDGDEEYVTYYFVGKIDSNPVPQEIKTYTIHITPKSGGGGGGGTGGGGGGAGGGGGDDEEEPSAPADINVTPGGDVTVDLGDNTKVSGGKATTTISSENAAAIVKGITENGSKEIKLDANVSGNVSKSEMSVPMTIASAASTNGASVEIATNVGSVVLDKQTVKGLAKTDADSITVSVEKTKESGSDKAVFDITLTAVKDGKATTISKLQGTAQVVAPLPSGVKAEEACGLYMNGKLAEKVTTKVDGKNVVLTVKHFSTYGIMSNADANKLFKKSAEATTINEPSLKASKGGKVKVSWKNGEGNVNDITKYQVCYKANGKKAQYTTTTAKSKTIKKLKKGKKYTVKVRAYIKLNGKTYKSKWSETNTVKCK